MIKKKENSTSGSSGKCTKYEGANKSLGKAGMNRPVVLAGIYFEVLFKQVTSIRDQEGTVNST